MPQLTTDLFDYDLASIIAFRSWPAGIKPYTVDHACRYGGSPFLQGPSSVYLHTTEFGTGVTAITVLEELDPVAALEAAQALTRAAKAATEDIDLEAFLAQALAGFREAKAHHVMSELVDKIAADAGDAGIAFQAGRLIAGLEQELGKEPGA